MHASLCASLYLAERTVDSSAIEQGKGIVNLSINLLVSRRCRLHRSSNYLTGDY